MHSHFFCLIWHIHTSSNNDSPNSGYLWHLWPISHLEQSVYFQDQSQHEQEISLAWHKCAEFLLRTPRNDCYPHKTQLKWSSFWDSVRTQMTCDRQQFLMLTEDKVSSSEDWPLGSNEFPVENLLSDADFSLPHCAFWTSQWNTEDTRCWSMLVSVVGSACVVSMAGLHFQVCFFFFHGRKIHKCE